MSRFQFRLAAPVDDVPGKGQFQSRFAPHALDGWIGQRVPHRFRQTDDGPVIAELGDVQVVAVQVIEEGLAALITYETVDAPAPRH